MATRRGRKKPEDVAKEFVSKKCDQDGFEIRLLEQKGKVSNTFIIYTSDIRFVNSLLQSARARALRKTISR